MATLREICQIPVEDRLEFDPDADKEPYRYATQPFVRSESSKEADLCINRILRI
jgi:hypothetical protein